MNLTSKFLAIVVLLNVILLLAGCSDPLDPLYSPEPVKDPQMDYNALNYNLNTETYNNPEYELPLKELPENYERDIMTKFQTELTPEQINTLLENGVVIIPGDNEKFSDAYTQLSQARNPANREDTDGVPTFITTDSIMHLFHLQFNELLKKIEVEELTPALNEFLDKTIEAAQRQYNGLEDKELQELSRRNVAYLSVAKKLLEPNYKPASYVKEDVNQEIERIEAHEGLYKNKLFSKDCPQICDERLYPRSMDYACNSEVKGTVEYEGKTQLFEDIYADVCLPVCYCEDYSQYVPRGHYTESEKLEQYFKSMMWLGRMTFKAQGEGWTKQAVLLTDAVKKADAVEQWSNIYTVTGFFAGASDDLSFYEYDAAVQALYGYEFDQNENLKGQITEAMQEELRKQRGPKILGGFEFDTAGNLKDTTQGMRVLGQRYALDSQILSDLVYNNVGVNPAHERYNDVITCQETINELSQPETFYATCESMSVNNTKYWNEVCAKAMGMHTYDMCGGLSEEELYGVCRYMPSGLDVMSVLGSSRANELTQEQFSSFCQYTAQSEALKEIVANYTQEEWTKNLYNAWLWMLQTVIEEKPEGYPNWMRTPYWQNKDLTTGLSSWAQLRHDTILYVKQSYTRATMRLGESMNMPMESKYYGYVEPNPELFARAKYITQYLEQGLEKQGMLSEEVKETLQDSQEMMQTLQTISQKELRGEMLSEEEYDYIKGIQGKFNSIINGLAKAVTIEGKKPVGLNIETHTTVVGMHDAFKANIIADVHTDVNTKKVLEVGTGYVDWMLVAHESKDGRIGLAVGPVFSYYEFTWPMNDRMTDEAWREKLATAPPERPNWITVE